MGLTARLDEHCQRGGYLSCVREGRSYPVSNVAEPARLVHRSCDFQRQGLHALIEFPLVGFRQAERWADLLDQGSPLASCETSLGLNPRVLV